ncbi:30S ribosome-binding factor RbfA [Tepidamorphus sp. 3E244]|uniref:30S ribosome-binding factor RbfA n=1 Tax=Tepidamorphus sp. 3E244 TaxID=3385498 RepID=UPI0038FCF93C
MNAAPNASRQGQRQLRVGELLRHALSDILQRGEINDPVLESHVITVPEVRISPDLKHASAYVMPLGGQDIEEVIEALNRSRKFVRGLLARRVDLKHMPQVSFLRDESFDAGARMDALLDSPQVRRDVEKHDDDAGDAGDD